ncbi:LysM domain-containing protein [Bacteroidetes oral taxon 274 str. F0058]|nr:LysM domain-containing protein [Bacteroidetes oral taxon 274 str. F0058]
MLSVCALAQDYPIKNIDGVDYYVYTVEPSEGLYRISKKFNVLQADIYKANPSVNEGLKAGQTLYIPVKNQAKKIQPSTTRQVIEHQVVAKQTLYSISKMYGVEKEEIIRLNPEIENGIIKIGQILRIPVSDKTKAQVQDNVAKQINSDKTTVQHEVKAQQPVLPKKKYVTYEVKSRKETLYGISKQFGVSINEIIEANPYAQDGIKKGDILQIPVVEENIPKTSGSDILHIVKPKETIYGISKQYNITKEDLLRANPKLENGLMIGDTILITSSSPQPTTTPTDNNAIVQKATYRIAYMLPFSAEEDKNSTNIDRFIEFYRGSLLAMEKIKEQGISLEVYTFDTQLGTAKINDILKNGIPKTVDMIIGPAYPEQVAIVADYAKKNNVIQIVPFTSQISNSDRFALQYQFNPSSADLDKAIINNILDKHRTDNVFIVNFASQNSKSYHLPERLEKALKSNSIKYTKLKANSLTADNISALNRNVNNLIVLSSCSTQEFKDFVGAVSADNKNYTFVVENDIFNYAKADKSLKNKNFVTYSLFNATPEDKYLNAYSRYFTVRTQQSTPNYDLLGYDITLYFCKALQPNKQLIFPQDIALQQSTFNFTKQNNAFLNTGCFIYRLKNNNISIERL